MCFTISAQGLLDDGGGRGVGTDLKVEAQFLGVAFSRPQALAIPKASCVPKVPSEASAEM